MVKVKLFGLLRIDSGIKELSVEADAVKEIFPILIETAFRNGKTIAIPPISCRIYSLYNKIAIKNINSCAVMVNGQQATKNTKIKDGDEVVFMSMVAGG